jgi:transcriptional regulator with XRE-family HTH domain
MQNNDVLINMKILIGERLREERLRLGHTQPTICEHLNASKKTLINWENGQSTPGADHVALLMALGMDVVYILTGTRTQPVAAESLLNRREQAVLEHYRHTDDEGKRIIESTASYTAQSAGKKTTRNKRA